MATRKKAGESNGAKPKRKPRGKPFEKGNPGGPGNPNIRRMAEHQAAVREAISGADLKKVLQKLKELAIDGDVQAAKVLLDRVLGKPKDPPGEATGIDIKADIASITAAVVALIRGQLAGDIDAATVTGALPAIKQASELVVSRSLEERIEALEKGAG